MLCPFCGTENLPGADECEECLAPLVHFDPAGSAIEQSLDRHPVAVLQPKDPVTLPADATVGEAIRLMAERRIGCVLVLEGEELAGIFTERDALTKVAPDVQSALAQPLRDFMTPGPETVRLKDSLAFALHKMDLGNYRHLPVVNEAGRPIGVVSVRDAMRFLCVRYALTW